MVPPSLLPHAQIPDNPLVLMLNSSLEIKFARREDVSVKFQCEGIMKTFDCGLKVRAGGE